MSDAFAEIRESRSRKRRRFAEFRDKPFHQYMADCYSEYWSAQKTNPKSPLYWFVWLVKGHDEMTPFLESPKSALEAVESYLSQWMREQKRKRQRTMFGDGGSNDPWREWFDVKRDDARTAFFDAWEKIRYRPGHSPLEQAFSANIKMRLSVSPETRDKRPMDQPEDESISDYEFFIGLAGHLQIAMGMRNIMLPCINVAELMEVSAMTVSRYRKWAVQDGYLREVKKHIYNPRGGKATEFRANPELWDCLAGRTTTGIGDNDFDDNKNGKVDEEWEDFLDNPESGDWHDWYRGGIETEGQGMQRQTSKARYPRDVEIGDD